jgi:hypothetical protein
LSQLCIDYTSEDLYSQCQSDFAGASDAFTSPHCGSTFFPLPELQVDGYNTVILYLTSDVFFLEEVNDPWFRTDIPWPYTFMDVTFYYRKRLTRALACAEKTELCKLSANGTPTCVQLNFHGWPLGSTMDAAANSTSLLGLSQRQGAIAHRLQDASYRGDFAHILDNLGASSMLAYEHVSGNTAASLLNDQW